MDTSVLRVSLLASYTADPLVPHLETVLREAGLPAEVAVGPFNQIVQQCLDDGSAVAAHRPDVLVVAPRIEELADPDELDEVAATACAAAGRWGAVAVLVLPAVPEHREFGVFDERRTAGPPAAAHAARERVRATLAERPDVLVVDAEQAVRAVGTAAAHHDSLFRFARIPYQDTVFAHLAGQVGAALRALFGAAPLAVAVDADPLVTDGFAATAELTALLATVRGAGLLVGLRGGAGLDWSALAARLPELTGPGLDGWVVDDRPVERQLLDLAAGLGVPAGSVALLSTATDPAGPVDVRLGSAPERWAAVLRASGLLDRLPDPELTPAPAPVRVRGGDGQSLAEYVAGLEVAVDCEPVRSDTAAKVAEVVTRAKDFTLALDEVDPRSPDLDLYAVRVRDRLGDYGIAGALGLRRGTGTVEVFSLSCVVLGKGVPDRVLARAGELAGGTPVRVRYRASEHNQVAVEFLAAADVETEEVR